MNIHFRLCHRHRGGFAVFLTAVIFVSTIASHAADWYVSKSAAGTGTGGSRSDAWTSIAAINWSKIAQGDTLWINGGLYNEPLNVGPKSKISVKIDPLAQTQAVFTWGQIYGCANVLIDGWLNSSQYFKFNGTSPIGNGFLIRGGTTDSTVSGLETDRSQIMNADTGQQHGIYTGDNVAGIKIVNCYVHDTSGDGISVNQLVDAPYSGFSNIVISNCVVLRIGDDGVQIAGSHATVQRSVLDTQGMKPLFGGHPDGVQVNPGFSDVLLDGNYFSGFNQYVFFEFSGANMRVINNVFESKTLFGSDRALNLSGSAQSVGWVIANNVAYNFLTYAFLNGGAPVDTVMANNILVNCRWASIDGAATNLFNRFPNLYYDTPGVQFYAEGTPVLPPENRNTGSRMFKFDPAFVNMSAGQFRLGSFSRAIGIGTNLSGFFNNDRVGIGRGASWDLGAYAAGQGPKAPTGFRFVTSQ